MSNSSKPEASLQLKLNADSGYSCNTTSRISADQWQDINMVLAGTLSSQKITVEALQGPRYEVCGWQYLEDGEWFDSEEGDDKQAISEAYQVRDIYTWVEV